jgi:hypothetical protein
MRKSGLPKKSPSTVIRISKGKDPETLFADDGRMYGLSSVGLADDARHLLLIGSLYEDTLLRCVT